MLCTPTRLLEYIYLYMANGIGLNVVHHISICLQKISILIKFYASSAYVSINLCIKLLYCENAATCVCCLVRFLI
jgi:hypothetical protein